MSNILSLNKVALLVTTSLVVAGCNTTANTPIDSGNTEIAKADAPSIPAPSNQNTKGMSQDSLMRTAERAWKNGAAPTALRLYGMAVQKNPQNPAPIIAMADILRKTKRPESAIELYKQVLETSPDLIAAHIGIGYSLLNQDKPYMSAQSFETAIALDPGNERSLGGMAVALDTAGEHDKAQDYYRLAIKVNSNNLTYQNNLALSLALAGRTDQAIAMLEIITAHPNSNAKHRQNLALAYGMAGKSADAMRYSRMDLSEKDARNNALYFNALTQETSDNLKEQEKQVSLLTTQNNVGYRTPETSRSPHSQLVAREQSVEIGTRSTVTRKASNSLPNIPDSPHFERYAKTPATANSVAVFAKSINEQQANIAAVPTPVVKMEKLAKPIAYRTSAPEAPDKKTLSDKISSTKALVIEENVEFAEFLVEAEKPVSVPMQNISVASGKHQYFAQLGSFRSRERALNGWNLLKERHSDLLGDQTPTVTKVELGEGKGTFFRVRIGAFAQQDRPEQLCKQLISRSEGCYAPRVSLSLPQPAKVATTQASVNQDKIPYLDLAETYIERPYIELRKYDAAFVSY